MAPAGSTRMSRRIVLVAMLLLAVILPVAGTLSLTAASQSVSLEAAIS
jgi:hypothetical protein